MKFRILAAAAALALFATVQAEEEGEAPNIVDYTIESCRSDIEAFCSQVTPGDERLLACFYAHEDKISSRCSYALYQAANWLEQAVVAMNYIATTCHADIEKHCAQVEFGEGRILTCLMENSEEISDGCNKAVDDVVD